MSLKNSEQPRLQAQHILLERNCQESTEWTSTTGKAPQNGLVKLYTHPPWQSNKIISVLLRLTWVLLATHPECELALEVLAKGVRVPRGLDGVDLARRHHEGVGVTAKLRERASRILFQEVEFISEASNSPNLRSLLVLPLPVGTMPEGTQIECSLSIFDKKLEENRKKCRIFCQI